MTITTPAVGTLRITDPSHRPPIRIELRDDSTGDPLDNPELLRMLKLAIEDYGL